MIAVQVIAFLISVQTVDGVGIKFIATDIKVKVVQNKYSNVIKNKSNLSIGLQHRWVLPVLRYPSNVIIYHYPIFWIILMVILLILIIQNYPNCF